MASSVIQAKNRLFQIIISLYTYIFFALQHAQMQRRIAALQRQTVRALWHVTGNDVSRQRRVAERIGVERLVEFIDLPRAMANSTDLSYVGSEALRALFTGADIGRHLAAAAECGAVQSLVRLLRLEPNIQYDYKYIYNGSITSEGIDDYSLCERVKGFLFK